jgi:hypothetical protein
MSMTDKELRDKARESYGADDIDVDGDAPISHGDGGSFVQAWVWVADKESENQ